MSDAAAEPCVDVPRIALGGAVRFVAVIALSELEIHDAHLPVVSRTLQERDYIRTAVGCGQQLGDVVVRDVVIVIDKGDVLPARDVEKCLALRSDAALTVVTQYQMLDLPRTLQPGTLSLDAGL